MQRTSPQSAIDAYLEKFAHPLARTQFEPVSDVDRLNAERISACRKGAYRWVMVVPAFDEPVDFAARLFANIDFGNQTKGCLLIRVINRPDDAQPDQIERTLQSLPDRSQKLPDALGNGVHMLTIDSASTALPAAEATGAARKLGNDIACALLRDGHIKTPLLCNTDADATLPADYFRRLALALQERPEQEKHRSDATLGAFLLPFAHHSDHPAEQAAATLYELYLRCLHHNLERSGSPYGYPALGSVLALNPVAYAKSRGFPKRRAGEDFYLLNKLAKQSEIVYLTGAPVELQCRISPRVVFGTGPALAKTIDDPAALQMSYSLRSFELLQQFFRGFADLQPQRTTAASARADFPIAWRDPDLLWLLKRLGAPQALLRLRRNHTTASALRRAMHEWFDALKTVRFLNEARHFHSDVALASQLDALKEQLLSDEATPERQTAPKSALDRAAELNRQLEAQRSLSRHSVDRAG